MKINIADLEHRYREMRDEDLLAIAPRDLTREARVCYSKEVARRELQVDIPEEVVEQEHQRVPRIRVAGRVVSYIREADARSAKWVVLRFSAYTLACLIGRLRVNWGVLVSFGFGCFIIAEILLPRAFRGRAPILWLRKFRPRSLRGFNFESFLFDACDCLGTPFTIQDRAYSYSYQTGIRTVATLLPVFFIFAMLLRYHLPEMGGNQSVYLFFVLMIAGMLGLFVFIPRWFGFKRVTDTDSGEQVAAQIRKIERGQVTGTTAAVVLRCSPTSWRTVVKRAQQLSALVVIDVTDLSENVLWEVETAVSLKAPQMIVLSHRIEAGNKAALPPLCAKQICERVGARTLDALPVFLYPANEEQLSEFEQPPSDALRRILARGLLLRSGGHHGEDYERTLQDTT